MILFTLLHKALRLYHVDVFVQIAIEKRCLDIHLMDLQIHGCPDCKNEAYGGEFGHRCKSLMKIKAVHLCKALCIEANRRREMVALAKIHTR